MASLRFLALSLLILGAWDCARAEQFLNTAGDKNESTSQYGGIAPEEIDQKLNDESKKVLERFKKGRVSSFEDGSSRYSSFLELHDGDFDSVSDHGGAGNSMEGGMDEAAIGKKRTPGGEARDKALEEARLKAGLCKGAGSTVPCNNISANVVDLGAAHGDDKTSGHRVYDLTKSAWEKAKQAGQDYGNKTIQESKDVRGFENSLPNGGSPVRDADGRVTSYKTVDGQIHKISGNIDFLKSEAAWLEQQKALVIDAQWKSMRAARLAGADNANFSHNGSRLDPKALREFNNIYLQKGLTPQQREQEVAKRINEYRSSNSIGLSTCPAGWQNISKNPKGPALCKKPGTKDDTAELATVGLIRREGQGNQGDQDIISKAIEQNRNKNPASKNEAETIQKISKCMQPGVWCYGNRAAEREANEANKNNKSNKPKTSDDFLYTQASGDPGNVFDDTRELIFHQLSVANKGPLDQFEKTMNSADLNKNTDRKTINQPYAKMMEEYQAAKKAYDDVRRSEQEEKTRNPAHQSQYLGDKFNSQRQSVNQLFGRNANRDGTTLSNKSDIGNSPGTNNSGLGNSGNQRNSGGSDMRAPQIQPMPARR